MERMEQGLRKIRWIIAGIWRRILRTSTTITCKMRKLGRRISLLNYMITMMRSVRKKTTPDVNSMTGSTIFVIRAFSNQHWILPCAFVICCSYEDHLFILEDNIYY